MEGESAGLRHPGLQSAHTGSVLVEPDGSCIRIVVPPLVLYLDHALRRDGPGVVVVRPHPNGDAAA